ncbi:hypothetical protein SAMN05216388_1017124 [Halorientalis persicus]|uniref:Uncharacterized protein n=1 Tax=Halorientalis persicus TaxID=1367881 RepID=A0A1H8S2H6_9EURY|nr:hypothetical protein [Halorientalis persicus]SEO72855.1 hypothetical protein SAMN05216388_1017124 [Halorientalis persicus]
MPRYAPRDETQGTEPRACQHCGEPGHAHDRERIYTDEEDTPTGSYHYAYVCPEGAA